MRYISILSLLIVIFSCSVQKRRYMNGFYVERHKKQQNTPLVQNKNYKAPDLPATERIEANAGDGILLELPKNKTRIVFGPDTCDKLIFRDGSEIEAKVTEVNPGDVKYKRCGDLSGPTYSTQKSDLFMIRYADGHREMMPPPEEKQKTEPRVQQNQAQGPVRNSNGVRVTEPHAAQALIAGLLSLITFLSSGFSMPGLALLFFVSSIVAAILAIRLARTARRNMEAEPNVYKGEGMATTGKVMGIITLSLYGLAVLIFLIFIIVLLLLI